MEQIPPPRVPLDEQEYRRRVGRLRASRRTRTTPGAGPSGRSGGEWTRNGTATPEPPRRTPMTDASSTPPNDPSHADGGAAGGSESSRDIGSVVAAFGGAVSGIAHDVA